MATMIDEQQMIQDNIFLYEQRLKSPIRRFTDKSFVPSTYFHVKNTETTVDSGYGDVEEILGPNSPIRFICIKGLPLYGAEQIVLNLNNGDYGLNTEYEGDVTVIAGTIKPIQNDHFLINTLKDSYIFRITEVSYDALVQEASYRVHFVLEYIDNRMVEQLKRQTIGYKSIRLENIGTDERAVIEEADLEKVEKIETMYQKMVDGMLTFYYNSRYNCLLGEMENGLKLYDPFQAFFINKHRLFHARSQIDGTVLSILVNDPKQPLKYERSIYRCFELRDIKKISVFPYTTWLGSTNFDTSFYKWVDDTVHIVDFPKITDPLKHVQIFSEAFVEEIKTNNYHDDENIYRYVIADYFNNPDFSIHNIPEGLEHEIMRLEDANLEIFFLTPVILYIIRTTITEYMRRDTFEDELLNVDE